PAQAAEQPGPAEQPDDGQQAAAEPADEPVDGPAMPAADQPAEQAPAAEQAGLGALPSLDQPAEAEAAPVVDVALLRAQWEQERRDAELSALVSELEGAG